MASFVPLVILATIALSAAAAPTQVVWCVPYDQPPAYARLCTKALAAANNDEVEFSCVVGKDSEGCNKMIAAGDAHLVTLDGGDMVTANLEADLKPLLFENYGVSVGTSYYAVAAVRKDFCDADTTLASLEGKRSCHTGYRKSAGWYSPLGALLSRGVMGTVSKDGTVEDDAESMAAFFSSTCAPRVTSDGPLSGGGKWDKLCTGCTGDCSIHDKYYDYEGAFRCMAEDAGDVAFIKHSTVPDFSVGGKSQADWAKDSADEFMLLCPSGGCQPLSEYASCHLAKVPAHAVVAEGSLAYGGANADLGKAIQDALVSASQKGEFLKNAAELGGQGNFLFKKGTIGLDAVTTTFESAVGGQFLADLAAVNSLSEVDDDGDR